MNSAYISALAALAGSGIGALATIVTTWLNQAYQNKIQRHADERTRRERLFGEFIVPIASPSLVRKMGGLPDTSLKGWPLLGDPSGRWNDWAEQFGMPLPSRYVARFDNTEHLQRAVLEGLGVALGRLVMARSLIECGALTVLCKERMRVAEAYYLVHPKRSEPHAGFSRLREWLLAEAADYESGIAENRALPA